MNAVSGWTGQLLQTALSEPPQLTLTFYSYGILLRKLVGEGCYTEYPVDAAQVAQALAARVRFDTGLITKDVLLIRREGLRELVVGYRKPQLTGIWLEGSPEPLRVPLPGLVLLRASAGAAPSYQVYAVKRRPATLSAPLYHAPLPNVFSSGSICWGNVPLAENTSLAADWQRLLGSPFGNHAVSGKSRQQRGDIRDLLLHLGATHKRTYPTRDLIPVESGRGHTTTTLEQVTRWEAVHD
jgi:hypothetical protein